MMVSTNRRETLNCKKIRVVLVFHACVKCSVPSILSIAPEAVANVTRLRGYFEVHDAYRITSTVSCRSPVSIISALQEGFEDIQAQSLI